MPIYEYECKTCDRTVEVLVRSSNEQPACPECGDGKMEKVFSVPASPSIRDGGSLPIASGESCGAPRCCGGGCNF